MTTLLKTSEVFGLNTEVSVHSYVDRGFLDGEIARLAARNQHICLKGESKSGKSWLRQKSFPSGLVVQCRIEFNVLDVFKSILAQMGIELVPLKETGASGSVQLSGSVEAGWKIIAKAQAEIVGSGEISSSEEKVPIGKDENDLEFICQLIKASGKRVIIEDFHYLRPDIQRHFAHDLKAMWDYGVYVVIIGVWVRRNYLTFLNPDLAGRIREVSIYWSEEDLQCIIKRGAGALNVFFPSDVIKSLVIDSFGNAGLLQSLALGALDDAGIEGRSEDVQPSLNAKNYENAALFYAEQLEAVFLEFARRVAGGIRKRKKATGIYAHAIWAVFDSNDDELIKGVPIDVIFTRAHGRQSRIQKGNLKSILPRLDGLQVDDRGKGLVVTYVEQSDSVAVVDRSVLFYRKYSTVNWPWRGIADGAGDDEMDGEPD